MLRPGGVFAGTDSVGGGRIFKLLHIHDTLVPVSTQELPSNLEESGLIEPLVSSGGSTFRFRAHKPSAAAL